MTTLVACPLCGRSSSSLAQAFEVNPIVGEWTRQLGMDVSAEFRGMLQFELLRCSNCTLQFFQPDSLAGSPSLYGQLEKFDWYYMRRKWEYDVALKDLDGCKNGIELGCGFGDFITRVIQEKKIPFEGSEQNPSAVEAAHRSGITVHLETAEKLATSRPGAYSAVCSFQVLEHLTRPADFLHASCNLLQAGGKLILGLPNADSFLRHQFNLLDMPPHHMTRWTAKVLSRLPRWFPLKLVRIAYEPLADYHVDGYVEAYTDLLARRGLRVFAMPKIRSLIARFIRTSGVQRALRGQTIYACYVRL